MDKTNRTTKYVVPVDFIYIYMRLCVCVCVRAFVLLTIFFPHLLLTKNKTNSEQNGKLTHCRLSSRASKRWAWWVNYNVLWGNTILVLSNGRKRVFSFSCGMRRMLFWSFLPIRSRLLMKPLKQSNAIWVNGLYKLLVPLQSLVPQPLFLRHIR